MKPSVTVASQALLENKRTLIQWQALGLGVQILLGCLTGTAVYLGLVSALTPVCNSACLAMQTLDGGDASSGTSIPAS